MEDVPLLDGAVTLLCGDVTRGICYLVLVGDDTCPRAQVKGLTITQYQDKPHSHGFHSAFLISLYSCMDANSYSPMY